MPNYRRRYVPGGTYFFTAVTDGRRPILTSDLARPLIHSAIQAELAKTPFGLTALVLLPDHLHTIWTLPDGDSAYPLRWKRIKEQFTRDYLAAGGSESGRSGRGHGRGRNVWQPRYWEHVVRDDDDFKRCLDYIHWNPVKHGLVRRVQDYPWSSFCQWVEMGEYDIDWGAGEVTDIAGAEWD
jgi:putative transposase